MFKQKKSEKQSVPTSVSEQKKVTPKQKKRRNRRIFRLVVLVLLIGFGWAGYNNLKHKSLTQIPAKTENPFTIQSAKSIPVNPNEVDTHTVPTSVLFQPSDVHVVPEETSRSLLVQTKQETEKNTDVKNKTEADIVPVSAVISDEDKAVDDTVPEKLEMQIEQDLSVSDEHNYTLRDALVFRDHFLSEQPCGEDFRKLILSDNKTSVAQEVIKNTSYFCLTTNNVYSELSDAFIVAKQNALIRYYYQQNNEWMAKIKSAFLYLIQIRNLNPVTDDIPAIMDKAHNALDAKNIALTSELIATLPQNLQSDFVVFLEKAKNYADAALSLEQLILSYAKGE